MFLFDAKLGKSVELGVLDGEIRELVLRAAQHGDGALVHYSGTSVRTYLYLPGSGLVRGVKAPPSNLVALAPDGSALLTTARSAWAVDPGGAVRQLWPLAK